ncbi:MAG TPA: pilus assembly protein TadG-related protein [Candidatus Dormibacteraeota bacterium]|nr:pilus assembly protein TadG-related protein [Candidatus Dormibacteraeota bacterium]
MWYVSSRKRQSGQLLPIAAAAFLVMCALAGLAIDASRDYLDKRNVQNAADFAVLAAAKQMSFSSNLNSAIAANAPAVHAAHDYAANNGFFTIYNNTCDSTAGGGFTTSWFDVAGVACGASVGFNTKVSVNQPAVNLPGSPVSAACTGAAQFSCVQVVITSRIAELFTSVLGINFAYVTVGAAAQAALPSSSFDAPPPNAVTIYQPQSGCNPGQQQCFDETKPVGRTQLSCTGGTNNCPTFWVRPGTAPKIYGYDGSILTPAGDYTTVRSNGDMVFQDRTTICDPYNGVACAANVARGLAGFAVPGGTNLYCSKFGAGAVSLTPCTTTGQASLNEIDSNQAGWSTPGYWYPTVDTTKLKFCGSLILNGQPMYGPCTNAQEPYLIGSGIYSSIVINHGNYELDSGLYDITGKAPVNTATGGGYTANGIDHSQEGASDFDLCTGGLPNSCPTLTAGIWIGHGGGNYTAYSGPTPGSCTNGVAGSGGGGGDVTVISGSGVVFRFEPNSGGFVSTHEVKGLTLAGAGVGALASVSGTPLLFDMENSSWIHLDSSQGGSGVPPNTTSGIIYQAPPTRGINGGGVEFNPSMAGFNVSGTELAAIQGQILAYSVTVFGTSGGTMDFTSGYGGGSVPGIGTSGRNENSIITSVNLTAGAPGYSILTVNYADEWMMDAYDIYAKINNGSPQFFSQGIWTTVPGPGTPLPPPGNNPGDANPAYPSSGTPGAYTIIGGTDWRYTIPGGNGATIEATGNWTWGHENTIPGAQTNNNTAQMIYTFPNPAGSYISVTLFLLDGDRCGDYAYATYTFKSTGGPGPGQQSIGSVSLVQ